MPISLKRLQSSGALTLHGTCEVCGALACFGANIHMRRAFLALDKGHKEECKRLLGEWFCMEHRP